LDPQRIGPWRVVLERDNIHDSTGYLLLQEGSYRQIRNLALRLTAEQPSRTPTGNVGGRIEKLLIENPRCKKVVVVTRRKTFAFARRRTESGNRAASC
jgi:hypothetical protein